MNWVTDTDRDDEKSHHLGDVGKRLLFQLNNMIAEVFEVLLVCVLR